MPDRQTPNSGPLASHLGTAEMAWANGSPRPKKMGAPPDGTFGHRDAVGR